MPVDGGPMKYPRVTAIVAMQIETLLLNYGVPEKQRRRLEESGYLDSVLVSLWVSPPFVSVDTKVAPDGAALPRAGPKVDPVTGQVILTNDESRVAIDEVLALRDGDWLWRASCIVLEATSVLDESVREDVREGVIGLLVGCRWQEARLFLTGWLPDLDRVWRRVLLHLPPPSEPLSEEEVPIEDVTVGETTELFKVVAPPSAPEDPEDPEETTTVPPTTKSSKRPKRRRPVVILAITCVAVVVGLSLGGWMAIWDASSIEGWLHNRFSVGVDQELGVTAVVPPVVAVQPHAPPPPAPAPAVAPTPPSTPVPRPVVSAPAPAPKAQEKKAEVKPEKKPEKAEKKVARATTPKPQSVAKPGAPCAGLKGMALLECRIKFQL